MKDYIEERSIFTTKVSWEQFTQDYNPSLMQDKGKRKHKEKSSKNCRQILILIPNVVYKISNLCYPPIVICKVPNSNNSIPSVNTCHTASTFDITKERKSIFHHECQVKWQHVHFIITTESRRLS